MLCLTRRRTSSCLGGRVAKVSHSGAGGSVAIITVFGAVDHDSPVKSGHHSHETELGSDWRGTGCASRGLGLCLSCLGEPAPSREGL